MSENYPGIDSFIKYKNKVEAEKPILTAEQRLITIDGVDGSGKSTIARLIFETLKKKYGKEKVVWADITNLKGSPKQDRLKVISKLPGMSDKRVDQLYIAGVNRAYEEIIVPALEKGKLVVVDRSELDLIRYALESENSESFEKRLKSVSDGTMTHNFWAGNRIFIESSAEDIWENLKGRGNLSKYDPQNFEEVKQRISAQKKAEEELLKLDHDGDINIVREINPRLSNDSELENSLNLKVKQIIDKLKFDFQ
jgi:thymidylate kinase